MRLAQSYLDPKKIWWVQGEKLLYLFSGGVQLKNRQGQFFILKYWLILMVFSSLL